jgi:hypothetical protein
LKETSTAVSTSLLRDKDYIYTPDEDSLTEFTDSESESEQPLKETRRNDPTENDNRTRKVKCDNNDSKQQEKEVKDSTSFEENKISETKDVKRKGNEQGEDSEQEDGDSLDPGESRLRVIITTTPRQLYQRRFTCGVKNIKQMSELY